MVTVISWREFAALALYRQFFIGLLVAYALGMGAVSVLFALNGQPVAAVTLVVGIVVGGAAVTVVPAKLGAIER